MNGVTDNELLSIKKFINDERQDNIKPDLHIHFLRVFTDEQLHAYNVLKAEKPEGLFEI
ncbi:MAG: hypothetical protein WC389_20450 [Lutibacter sp.]|jgi:hypothetical protein